MIEALNQVKTVAIAAIAATSLSTISASFDCKGADYAVVSVNLSARKNTNAVAPTLSLLSSDDTVVTNHVTVVANRTESLANAHAVHYFVDCKSGKRYLRLTVSTGTATNDDVTVGADITTSRKEQSPASTAALAGSTNDAVVIV